MLSANPTCSFCKRAANARGVRVRCSKNAVVLRQHPSLAPHLRFRGEIFSALRAVFRQSEPLLRLACHGARVDDVSRFKSPEKRFEPMATVNSVPPFRTLHRNLAEEFTNCRDVETTTI